jgi:hypothetical protein
VLEVPTPASAPAPVTEGIVKAENDVCGITVFAHDHLELQGLFELAHGACQNDTRSALEPREQAQGLKRANALRETENLLQEYFAHDFSAEE